MKTINAYQGRTESKASLDDFPTPPWATRALCQALQEEGLNLSSLSCREPAANRGFMVRALSESFGSVVGSDVLDYGQGFPVRDFLHEPFEEVDFTVTNPPYVKAEEFAHKMIATSRIGCALLLRTAFLEGKGRFARLYTPTPPALVLQFVERVAMESGKVDKKTKSAVPYAWIVWLKGQTDTRLKWIAPRRAKLERESDYDG